MCNQYRLPHAEELFFGLHLNVPRDYQHADVFPQSRGYFVRRSALQDSYERELVAGQWGLVPWFAKSPKLPYSTSNARSEELESNASYRDPWAKGQRCIIPASIIWGLCGETGENVWWAFRRADGNLMGLAGIWNTWVDRESGEAHESYSMVMINADANPLMRRMHKPDNRMVVMIEPALWETWLEAPVSQVSELMTVAPAELFEAWPDPRRQGHLFGPRPRCVLP